MMAAVWCSGERSAEASHYRGGNIYYENLGTLGGTSAQKDWIVIKATMVIYQRGSAHCSANVVSLSGAAPAVAPHNQTCCNSSGRPSGCLNRWRQVGGSFTWGAGGQPHPTLSSPTIPYQPLNQASNTFTTTYMKVIDEDTQQDFLGFELVLYRIYPPTTVTTTMTWGSCCWISGTRPSLSNFSISVTAQVSSGNQDPQFNSPLLINACTNQSFTQNLNPSDPDRDGIEVILTPTSGGADQQNPVLTVSKAGVITWTKPVAGLWIIKVTAYDLNANGTRKGASTFRDFLLNVSSTCSNRPPTITLTPQTISVKPGQQACTKVSVSDPDTNDKLTIRVNPTKPNVTVTPTNALSPNQNNPFSFTYCWTPAGSDEGTTHNIQFTVSDSGTPVLSAQATFGVTVTQGTPPVVTVTPSGNKTVDEGKCTKFTAVASDPDSSIQDFTAKFPSFCTAQRLSATSFEVECCPTFTDGGKSYDVTFTATDRDGVPKTTTSTVKINVTDVNRPPDVTDPGPQTIDEKKAFKLQIKASDPDGDTLTYSMTGLPAGAKIDPSTGEITWTPQPGDIGDHTATITVSDGKGGKKEIKVKFTVSNVNDPPVITTTAPTVAYVGEDLGYEPKVTDPDANDKQTWKLKQGPPGATVDPTTGKVSWTPAKGDAGKQVSFSIEVCDDGTPPSCVTQTWTVTVYLKCRVDEDCDTAQICVQSSQGPLVCVAPGCASQTPKCSNNEFCKEGKCGTNPCDGKTCGTGEFCRPTDGKCVKPCAGVTCPAGEKCVDGGCQEDPCAKAGANGGPCAFDEVCDTSDTANPKCVKNPCGAQSCRYGRVCSNDRCIDDPCATISCPDGTTQRCVAGQCLDRQKCSVDIDCPGDEVCLAGKCFPPGCYTSSPQCSGNNERCVGAKCQSDDCANGTKTCAADEFCRPTDNTCVKSCANVSCQKGEKCSNGVCAADPCDGKTCQAGETCVAGTCEKDNCNASNVCRHGRVCSKESNTCKDDPCAGVQCAKGAECREGECKPPPECIFDSECPGEWLCVNKECVKPECKADSDCSGKVCREGKCLDDPCKDKQCPEGQVCKNGQCTDTCAGVFCAEDERCVDGKCVKDPCKDQQCAAGEVCVNGSCTEDKCAKATTPCKQNRLCQVDKCVDDPCAGITCPQGLTCKDGQCTGEKGCTTDSECPNGGVCVDGKCAPSGCYKATCDTAKLCLKGKCGDDACGAVSCSEGEFCRPSDGTCVKTCPTCKEGEVCTDGQCGPDPCAGKTCPTGETCTKGQCAKDICSEKDADTTYCRYGRVCKANTCQDDPCQGVKCESDATCKGGVCVGPPVQITEPTPEPVVVDAGDTPEAAIREFFVAGGLGCVGCSVRGSAPEGFVFLLMFFALLFAIRRRRS